jgi:hypothetical protein
MTIVLTASAVNALPVIFLVLYTGDYLRFRLRISYSQLGQALRTVQFYLATSTKNDKEEAFFDQLHIRFQAGLLIQ